MTTKTFQLSDDYTNSLKTWERARDAYSGERALKRRTTTYIPKLTDQTDDEYDAYLARTYYFNSVKKTVRALAGMVTRRPAKIQPSRASEVLKKDKISKKGLRLNDFVGGFFKEALLMGRAGVLVDYGRDAFLAQYKTEDIYDVQYDNTGEKNRVWLHESKVDKDDLLLTNHYVRELILEDGVYKQKLYLMDNAGLTGELIETIVPEMNGIKFSYIPFYMVMFDFDELDDSLMLPLVDLGIAHFKQMADYKHLLHYASVPTLFISGIPDDIDENGKTTPPEIRIGSENALVASNPEANAKWISCDSAAANPIRNELQDIEERMGASAASLATSAVSRETATSAAQRNSGNTASVITLVRMMNSAITSALQVLMEWRYRISDDTRYDAPLEFTAAPIDAPMLLAMIAQYEKGLISLPQFLDNLERGEAMGETTAYEEEQRLRNPDPLPETPEERKADIETTSLAVDNNAL